MKLRAFAILTAAICLAGCTLPTRQPPEPRPPAASTATGNSSSVAFRSASSSRQPTAPSPASPSCRPLSPGLHGRHSLRIP